MIFQNPVRGTIQPNSWNRPPGNREFRVTQDFGPTSLKAERPLGKFAHFHRGLDLGNARCGGDVLAAGSGRVTYSTFSKSLGNRIVINHGDDWFTSYGHLARRTVAKGERVKAGQKIGDVGDTGLAIGCHLHFGVKSQLKDPAGYYLDSKGEWEDPWPLLEQNVTVRLRALDGINVRDQPELAPSVKFATTKGGRILRLSDDADLGAASVQRPWSGTVEGAKYPPGDDYPGGNEWEQITLDGAVRYVASPLAVLSA